MLVQKANDLSVTIEAPAKVNLFLEVMGKRPDGYHEINSVFQAVSLYDRLEFTRTEKAGISIDVRGPFDVPSGEDNIIAQAYHLMKSTYGFDAGLEVSLDKQIPVAAGLGGGSSDAAATIVACNMLFDLNLSNSEQIFLAARVGSDLPFFFTGGQALVRGRGEVLEEMELATDYYLVLVNPGFELSTSEGYAKLKRDLTMHRPRFNLGPCPRAEELVRLLLQTGNDFEDAYLQVYPDLGRIRDRLLQSGASLARMSGSGPTMFGIFFQAPENFKGEDMAEGDWHVFTVVPVTWPSQA